ncbi:hypothetical protein ABMA27_008767 [Loxostege sticticalis]|uniref:CCHC-type domain-containing protein n=1 Tax=Loxostege sticticalis TaxID=481309 RepID=A0ABR3H8T7_LOXSC
MTPGNETWNVRHLEPKVVLQRLDLSEFSDSSVQTMVTVRSDDAENRSSPLKFWDQGRKRGRDNEDEEDSDESPITPSKVPTVASFVARRGRGRPPTTGEHIGKAKYQAALKKLQHEELKARAEEEIAALTAKARATRTAAEERLASQRAAERDETVTGLLNRVGEGIALVQNVKVKSKRLKGTMQAALQQATDMISAATNALADRTISEEVRDLRKQNADLKAEMSDLKKELAELKAALREKDKAAPAAEVTLPSSLEEWASQILSVTTARINARVEGLESRLNPEPRFRPESLSGKQIEGPPAQGPFERVPTRTPKDTQSQPEASKVPPKTQKKAATLSVAEATTAKSKKKRQKKAKVSKVNPVVEAAPSVPRPLPPAPTLMNEGWSTVAKRGKKTSGSVAKQVSPKTQTANTVKVKSRPPRSTAVVLTVQPGADERGVTYEKAISEAKRRIDISELGIEAVRFRRAVTGATIIEIPGATSNDKADSLAARLKQIFEEGDVKISRPTKCSELRVSGLDDAVTAEEIAAAVAKLGDCPVEQVKVGTPRSDHTGLFASWVRCPVAAAKKVVDGRLLVGWVAARVKLLPNREMRCFKCLEAGHVQAVCPVEVDRSRQCYRCGQLGHIAADCTNEPHCTLCAAADKPAGHRVGSKACKAPPHKIGRKAAARASGQPKPSRPSQGPEEIAMSGA